MRNLIRLLQIATMLVFASATLAKSSDNVVDYYNELREIEGLSLDYPVYRQDKRWVSENQAWANIPDTDPSWIIMPITVDTGNGYIYINDEGTGGGSFVTQVVLYRQADGSPLIGIAENGFSYPPAPSDSSVRFYSKQGGKWVETTTHIWPDIHLSNFLQDEMTMTDLQTLKDIGASVYFEMPQHGTTAYAYLSIPENMVDPVCNGEDWMVVPDKTPYLNYCANLRGRLFNKIGIVWDKPSGTFWRGDMMRVELPWEN